MALSNIEIEKVFNLAFSAPYNTQLTGGFNEPEYIPAGEKSPAQIRYREDFARSALHEVAHWCVAGGKRRQLFDYGYWYAPDGRSLEQQKEFYRMEVKPQALEWIFASAAGLPFKPSTDNLSLDASLLKELEEGFVAGLKRQVRIYLQSELYKGDLAQRALVFAQALQAACDTTLLTEQDIEEARF